MKAYINNNKILIILALVFAISGVVSVANRISIERTNKTYDIVADYTEIQQMAQQAHKDESYFLKKFKDELDIHKIGLSEENLVSLSEDCDLEVSSKVMGQVTTDANWRDDYPEDVLKALEDYGYDKNDVLIEMGTKRAADFVLPAIKARFEKKKYVIVDKGDKAYALIDGNPQTTLYSQPYKLANSKKGGFIEKTDLVGSKIMYISLGLLPEKVEKIQAAGMEIIPRTLAYGGYNGKKFGRAVIAEYEKYGIVPEYLIAGGEGVMGSDDGIKLAQDYIENNGITIGLIENTTQLQNILQNGVEEIAKANDYNTVRVFSVWNYIQYRYKYYGYKDAKEIENTLFRAVTERNIRVIYFKPIKENQDLFTYVTDMKDYKTMFENLHQRLGEHNFNYGSASVMKNHQVGMISKILMAFSAITAAVLLLMAFIPIKRKHAYVLTALGYIGALGASYVIPNSFELLLSFASACVFACLSVTLYVAVSKKLYDEAGREEKLTSLTGKAVITLIVCVAISLMGGIMTCAPLSSTSYMLEIDIFRGVKLAQLIPIAYFAVAYLAYFGFGNNKRTPGKLEFHDLKDMMNTSIRIWMIVLGGMIGAVGVYYILRTGHDSALEVSSLEMLFRNFLEDSLIARPRTKEFLFAFPAVMLCVYTAGRKYKFWPAVFGLCGVIGMTSVNNTFMHIRTPLYLGFTRTGYSLIFGLVAGVVGILVFEAAHQCFIRWIKPLYSKYEVE